MSTLPIIDRYIGRSVIVSTFVVLIILLALFTFFSFLDEIKGGSFGKGNYGTWQAIQFAFLNVPQQAYQLFPVSALLGATIGLGALANNGELVVIRASGVSLLRIIVSVMKAGLVFVVLTVIVGEAVAPMSERYAQTLRSSALSQKLSFQGKNGLWARDGQHFINVREILPGDRLGQILIYEREQDYSLKLVIQAEAAVYREGQWVLQRVVSSKIGDNTFELQHDDEVYWDTRLQPELLNVVTVQASTLSVLGLYQYVSYLKENRLDASIYEQAMWRKLVAPLVTAVMVFLAIPFVFGPLRSVTIGHRILVGVLVGVGFYLINQMFNYIALVFGLNAIVSAVLPVVLAFVAGWWMLRRIH